MSSLPPALDFTAMEEEICLKWKTEDSFKMQDKLSLERGDKVRSCCVIAAARREESQGLR
jgi:hypothetical protein